jgi:hypothetical protein
MAEHSDAAEQIDEQTPPDDGTDVDEHDTDAGLAEVAWPTWGQQLAAMSADLAANIR